jgi:CheY-like chemotaxis protein
VQGDRSLDRAKGGLGLGLSLVRRLVALHGGSVAASSAGPGQGSEFVVRLPLAHAVAPGPARGAGPDPTRSRRVAVIEDNADARDALCYLLEAWGHLVRHAADGESGVALLRTEPTDIALVDLGLPRLDGYGVARAVRALPGGRDLHLVALTGYGQPEDRRRARDAGFDGFLVKPVDPESLSQVLAHFGGSRAA